MFVVPNPPALEVWKLNLAKGDVLDQVCQRSLCAVECRHFEGMPEVSEKCRPSF
jgi:hypothetical protein